jgi:hypothetical protein
MLPAHMVPSGEREDDASSIRVGCLPHGSMVQAADRADNPLLETCP